MSPLTWIILLPLAGALALLVVPAGARGLIRGIALGATGASALIALGVLASFEGAAVGGGGYRFVQRVPWVEDLGIAYAVGVDGINLGLVVMAALVALGAAWLSSEITERVREFHLLLLLMTAGVLGAFASLDLFFLYVFHELALVPTFIMIGVWGRGPRRAYAAFQITIYLSVGALIALVGLIALYLQAGTRTFDLVALGQQFAQNPIPAARQSQIFPWLLFGFGILVSLWPFHTWAPLGYASAPTATAMLHAGALKKFGVYVLLKVALPFLPEGARAWLPLVAWLCLGNILYAGWVAMRQRDLNLLIGTSSVAHVGFIFLGLASLTEVGITGAVMVMVAHGLLAALSFALSGWLHRQSGNLDMTTMGGLLQRMPFIGTVMIMAMMAGCGLPGFGNFVGELLVLFGGWRSPLLSGAGGLQWSWFIVAAAWGALLIAALYMLRAIRRIWHGPPDPGWQTAADPGGFAARAPYAILLVALVWIGVWPRTLTDHIRPEAARIAATLAGAPAAAMEAGAPALARAAASLEEEGRKP